MKTHYRRILLYARTEKTWLLALLGLSVLSSCLAAVVPWPLKVLVDNALGEASFEPGLAAFLNDWEPLQLVLLAAVISLLFSLLYMLISNLLTWGWSVAGQRMVYRFAADVFDHIKYLSLRFHSLSKTGDLLSRITADTYCVYKVTEAVLISPFRHLLTIGIIALVAYQLNAALTLVLLGVVPLLVLMARYFGPKLRVRATVKRDAGANLTSFVHQVLSALPIVKVFCAESRNIRTYQNLAGKLVRASVLSTLYENGFKTLNGLGTAITIAIIVFLGGRSVIEGSLSVGSFLVFIQYGRNLMSAFEQVMATFASLKNAEANLTRLVEVLDSEDLVTEVAHPDPLPEPKPGEGSRVEIKNVQFGWRSGQPILNDLSVIVEAGQHVAIVGATGAGKTTLLSLLPRFCDPWRGNILIDGVDIRQAPLNAVRRRFGIVMQKPILLPATIAENIAFGCETASMAEIEEAAKAANAHDFICRLPEGYQTRVEEGGANFSGGEKQRIAIARSLMNSASIIILDEPTSALDGHSEREVMDALSRLTRGCTTFTMAHHCTTTGSCDRILVMQDGRIVEDGTHDALLEAGGLYSHLFREQYRLEAAL